ncbi:serine/threonine-protein phosphatase PP1-2-like [Tropilaelaps mercedesae]|uniref:Serine/threonine-protein phosphatase n=1 Tax=Tropilaelaps mercedesae TaxID=418985 RepID=A0A1V9X6N9_9ACAR|nr:serine/threonine-protein phosphatase PP1-2-like [Tropilaelaps mercedesae]
MPESVPTTKTVSSTSARLPEAAPKSSCSPAATPRADAVIDTVLATLLGSRQTSDGTCTRVHLTNRELLEVTRRAQKAFSAEPMLLRISPPLRVFGDLHGQFRDFLLLLDQTGLPPSTRFLFLGDYVDRGEQSLEVITLLFALKVRFPTSVFLLRGNHEVQPVNRRYGFFEEVTSRYNLEIYGRFGSAFSYMPVAAIVGEKIFCVHGGISPRLHSLDQILDIQRPARVPKQGLLTDLLWADPHPTAEDFADNHDRGISVIFGPKQVEEFLERFDLDLICRGHQLCPKGHEFFADQRLLTIFSAPNYCGQFDNAAGVLSISKNLECEISTFRPTTPSAGGLPMASTAKL